MSETVLKILAAELATLRVTCPKCQAAVEFQVAAMETRELELECPLCATSFPDRETLVTLSKALKKIAASKRLTVEFILPVKPAESR